MPNIAAIDGYTGPGRRTVLIQGDVQEVTFRLGKKVVEITNKDGSMGSYDLAQVESIQVTSDGKDFTIAATSKHPEEEHDESKSAPESAKTHSAATGTAAPVTKQSAG